MIDPLDDDNGLLLARMFEEECYTLTPAVAPLLEELYKKEQTFERIMLFAENQKVPFEKEDVFVLFRKLLAIGFLSLRDTSSPQSQG